MTTPSDPWIWSSGPAPAEASVVDRFLRAAVLVYDATDADAARLLDASSLLAAHPDLVDIDIAVAAVSGDSQAVAGHLAADPGSAARPTGPYGWSPLLYLAYARLPSPAGRVEYERILRLLLEAGADPNDGRLFGGGVPPFTVLTGLSGSGEGDQPPHPYALQLARIVLEAGADPNDGQTLYNRMFGADDSHLELLFEFGLGTGDGGVWRERIGDELDSPTRMLGGLLHWAVTHDQRTRVELLAGHGVDLSAPLDTPFARATRGYRPVDIAAVNGHVELVALVQRLGGGAPDLDAVDRVIASALSPSEGLNELAGVLPADVERARSRRPGLIVWAAALGRPDAVSALLRLGFDINARGRGDTTTEQGWETALHVAAGNGDLDVARRLVAAGADPSIRDVRFDATPLGWARHFDRRDLVELLEPLTDE